LTELFPKGLTFLEGIPVNVLNRLVENSSTQFILAGQSVLSAGEKTDAVYLSYYGHLRVTLVSPSGREMIVRDIFGGDMFGEVQAIDGLPRNATILAVEDSKVARIPATAFRSIVSDTPEAALWFALLLTKKIRPLLDQIYELNTMNVRARLQSELLRMCMMAGVEKNCATINRPPTHDTIAAKIATHREAVTRELGYLASIGLIKRNARRLEVSDVARLATMVAEHSAAPETGESYL
jgi:CRP/FNR family cyclic AMP-dependent transcriptional regulator